MQSGTTASRACVIAYLTKHPQATSMAAARHLFKKHPMMWSSLDAARTCVRRVRGAQGENSRKTTIRVKHCERTPDEIKTCVTWGAMIPEPSRNAWGWKTLPPGIGKWLILCDIHMPYHDPTALKAALTYGEGCDGVLLNGDNVDSYSLSRFEKDPEARNYDQEIEDFGRFLDALVAWGAKKIVMKLGNHECFDTETEVLTADGWLRQEAITPFTRVGSLNQATGEIEYAPPLAIHRSHYTGDMRWIHNKRSDLMVTPNHRMLFRPGGSGASGQWRMLPLSSIPSGNNRLVLPVAGSTTHGDLALSDDEIRIAAWILTDASITNQQHKTGHVSKHFTFYQRAEKVHLITEILDRLGWRYSTATRQRRTKIIRGRTLTKTPSPSVAIRLLMDSGRGSRGCPQAPPIGRPGEYLTQDAQQDGGPARAKQLVPARGRLPAWVHDLSNRQFRVFLASFVDGDGSRHISCPDTSWMAHGTKAILEDLQVAAICHAYRASLSEYRPGDWRLNLTPGTTLAVDRVGRNTTSVPYDGVVWCVTTKNDTVVVRRNGKVTITGNSRLERYLLARCPELWQGKVREKIGWRAFLDLDQRGIMLIDSMDPISVGKLTILHGHEFGAGATSPVNPARSAYLKGRECCLVGHQHRASEHTEVTMLGTTITTWSTGCLCDLHPRYRPINAWGHGAAILDLTGEDWRIQNFRIVEGRVV